MALHDFEELVETFEFLDDWEDRYRHVIDMGKVLPSLDESLKISQTKVEGCASQVWLVPRLENGRFGFDGDSDAIIVKGLIAVLQVLYRDTPLQELSSIDATAQLARLGLDGHLSAQRSNGLRAMVARIREFASPQS